MTIHRYGEAAAEFRFNFGGRVESRPVNMDGLRDIDVHFRVRFYEAANTVELLVAPNGLPFFGVEIALDPSFTWTPRLAISKVVFGHDPLTDSPVWDDVDFTLGYLSMNGVVASQFVPSPPPPPPFGTPPAPPGPSTAGESFVPVDTRAYLSAGDKTEAMQFVLRDAVALSAPEWELDFRISNFETSDSLNPSCGSFCTLHFGFAYTLEEDRGLEMRISKYGTDESSLTVGFGGQDEASVALDMSAVDFAETRWFSLGYQRAGSDGAPLMTLGSGRFEEGVYNRDINAEINLNLTDLPEFDPSPSLDRVIFGFPLAHPLPPAVASWAGFEFVLEHVAFNGVEPFQILSPPPPALPPGPPVPTNTFDGIDTRNFALPEEKKTVMQFTYPDVGAEITKPQWSLSLRVSRFSGGSVFQFGFGFTTQAGRGAAMRVENYGTANAQVVFDFYGSAQLSPEFDMSAHGPDATWWFTLSYINVFHRFTLTAGPYYDDDTLELTVLEFIDITAVPSWDPAEEIDRVTFGFSATSELSSWGGSEFVLEFAALNGLELGRWLEQPECLWEPAEQRCRHPCSEPTLSASECEDLGCKYAWGHCQVR